MIGFFPKAYPDELLYSICARYSDMVRYSSKSAINTELFGTPYFVLDAHLPSHLEFLIKSLPSNISYSLDSLIGRHTHLPFYAPFLLPSKVRRIKKLMNGSRGTAIHLLAGITPSRVQLSSYLNFCPQCVVEEKSLLGECYWHRLHQIPVVKICPAHNTFLNSSRVRSPHKTNSVIYITDGQASTNNSLNQPNPSNPFHKLLLDIARDTDWLLNQSGLVPNIPTLLSGYTFALKRLGYMSAMGRLHAKKLFQDFNEKFPNVFLKELQCDYNFTDDNFWRTWPLRFINDLKRGLTYHPIRHLLFINFVGYTLKDFFEMLIINRGTLETRRPRPFGKGPWPCLNHTCPSHGALSINECLIRPNASTAPKGIFQCYCGFTYVRSGPDLTPEDKFHIGKVIEYGAVWEDKLRNLWADPSVSRSTLARLLGVDYLTAKRHAVRLNLPFPRLGPTKKLTRADIPLERHLQEAKTAKRKKLNSYRELLLSTLRQYPTATRTQIRNQLLPIKVFAWLFDNDFEWLQSRLPVPMRSKGGRRAADWETRDVQLAEDTRRAVIRLKSADGRPLRITKGAIRKELGNKQQFLQTKFLSRLPLTAAVLSEQLETRVEFALRRVKWAAACFRLEGKSPTWDQLASRTATNHDIWYEPTVKAAIDEAYLYLQNQFIPTTVEAA